MANIKDYKKEYKELYQPKTTPMIEYTIKMSKMGGYVPKGYFDYVVPPLEGFWWLENKVEFTPENKSKFCWISLIRLPEFVDEHVFTWACEEASKLKTVLRIPVKR